MSGKVAAVILAGGRSTRMGGGDKAPRALAGRPMLAHVIESLKPQAGPLAVNANGDPARFEEFGLPVIRDTVSGFAGPLAGILAGVEWAAQIADGKYVVTVAGDTPFFRQIWWESFAMLRTAAKRSCWRVPVGKRIPFLGCGR